MRPLLVAVFLAPTPVAQEPAPPAPPPAAVDFQREVAPILLARCIDCHGPKEQKGDLRLDARAHLFPVGGEDAWTVRAGKPDESELLRRLALPPDDEEIMPAKGEPLSKEQQALLRRWVEQGAVWPAEGDAFLAAEIAAQVLPKITFSLPELAAEAQAAVAAGIAALRERGAVVQAVAADTEALDVNLSLLREQIGDADLALLEPLAPRLVWLNVSRTKVSDAGMVRIGKLTELRRLHAANTALTDAAVPALQTLSRLEYLNLYGSQIGDAGLAKLAAVGSLRQLYLWQTKVTAAGVAALRAALPAVQVDLGDYVEARLAAAQQEIAARAERQRPVNDTCPVADKPIDPAQTVQHEGRVVAFCCAKCKAAFVAEPAKFAAKLPAAK
jgi:mono/diheme cytochrome c family protein